MIPGVLNGRGKLFYFANYSLANDAIPGKIQGSITVPANEKHLQGDFSDLLQACPARRSTRSTTR